MIEVRNRPEKHRFEITVDGEVAGYTEFRSAPRIRAFVHTVIEKRFEGRGLAAKLVAAALDATRTEGLLVEPYCPYVRSFIAKHLEYLDLVPEDRREQFGLPQGRIIERKGA